MHLLPYARGEVIRNKMTGTVSRLILTNICTLSNDTSTYALGAAATCVVRNLIPIMYVR